VSNQKSNCAVIHFGSHLYLNHPVRRFEQNAVANNCYDEYDLILNNKAKNNMAQAPVAPVVLVILDGWGYRPDIHGNAIAQAQTPNIDSLWAAYPHTLIDTSGRAVGLPDGQMGNSEVGHLNIGAGRIVPQELVRISDAVKDKSILNNPALVKVCVDVQQRQSKLHILGLCSDGGVHSHLDHLIGLLELARDRNITEVCLHVITDGRDTDPRDGLQAVAKIEAAIATIGVGKIVTVSGRYHALDRDNRWDRVKLAYDVMTQAGEGSGESATALLTNSYAADKTDEFIDPTRIAPGAIEPGDGVIFFNFRPDRARQLTSALVNAHFTGFIRSQITPLTVATFTQYDSTLPVLVAFEPQQLQNLLGEVISERGFKQFRVAETEKYAHVTYFFNGGREEPLPGEDRELIPSPQVSTYDRTPAMSAALVTETVLAAIAKQIYTLIVVNYANPDMVGHTGKMAPTIQAIETVDACLGKLLEGVGKVGGTTLITADHGNAEYMCDENDNPWTAHTTSQVPLILVEGERRQLQGHGTDVTLRDDGKLADLAPTILEILQIPQPIDMTGKSMVVPALVEFQQTRSPMRVGV
jgi:2,3-bisphosphoglycerate-independent phosphoglycerate mutase